MAERFTPGPWRINSRAQFCVESQDGRSVASTAGYQRVDDGGASHNENAANAHLIAAAPDLYGALKSWFDCFDQGGSETGNHEEIEAEFKRLMSQSRAALSKAHPTQGDE